MTDKFSQMREQITFQSESLTPDSGGGNTLSWSNGSTVWAHVKPLARTSGLEASYGGQLEDRALFAVTTRYISGITANMRILYGSRVLNIRTVRNVEERSEFLEIIAEEGVAT